MRLASNSAVSTLSTSSTWCVADGQKKSFIRRGLATSRLWHASCVCEIWQMGHLPSGDDGLERRKWNRLTDAPDERTTFGPHTQLAEPPVVEVAPVVQRTVPAIGEWVGTTEGYVNAQIQPQVSGYLIRQDYREGAYVKKGRVLFEIDPRPFQAALDQAKGQLAQAEAQVANADLNVKRDIPEAEAHAIPQGQLDTDTQSLRGAKAAVEADQAAVEQAQLNLGYTRVSFATTRAPAGRSPSGKNMVAANAQIGVAKASFFPNLALTGTGGLESNVLNKFITQPSETWNAAFSVSQPVFQAGALRSGLKLSRAQWQEAVLSYQQTVQNALEQVSNALIASQKNREFREQQDLLTQAAQRSDQLSQVLYQHGGASYLQVLTNATNYCSAELHLVQAQLSERLALVQLYQALGGGWQQ